MKKRILAFVLLATLFACSNDDSIKVEETPVDTTCPCQIKRYRVNTNASGYPIDTVFVSNVNQVVREECGTVRTQPVPFQGNMFWYMYDEYICE